RISSIFVRTNWARLRFNLGDIGGFLVIKLVKPTKLFCSGTAYQSGVNQIRVPKAQSDVGTTAARVLGKTNAAMGQKLCRLDALNSVADQGSEFLPLFLSNCGLQILNFHQPFADEDDLRHLSYSADPGITKQLRIKRQQTFWLVWIT